MCFISLLLNLYNFFLRFCMYLHVFFFFFIRETRPSRDLVIVFMIFVFLNLLILPRVLLISYDKYVNIYIHLICVTIWRVHVQLSFFRPSCFLVLLIFGHECSYVTCLQIDGNGHVTIVCFRIPPYP